MKTIVEILTEKLSEAFIICGYSAEFGLVKLSDRPDLCQFQCNGAFSAAKIYKKAPAIIAEEVVTKLQDNSVFQKISVMGADLLISMLLIIFC